MRRANKRVAQIKARGIAIDFKRHARLGRGGNDKLHVGFKARSTVQNSTSGVANHMHKWIGDGGKQARGGGLGCLLQRGVRAGHHPIKFGKNIVGIIQMTVGKNVHLAANKNMNAFYFCGGGANVGRVLTQTLNGKPVGLRA